MHNTVVVEELFPKFLAYLREKGRAHIGDFHQTGILFDPTTLIPYQGEVRPVYFNDEEIGEVRICREPLLLHFHGDIEAMERITGLNLGSTGRMRMEYSEGRRKDAWDFSGITFFP